MQNIAAIIVTFNRKSLLNECITGVANQTLKPTRIYIIDNASTDGTAEFIRDSGYLSNDIVEYIRLPENIGGSGGFYEGMKTAVEKGHDFVWIMDDDAEPEKDCLSKLMTRFKDDSVAAVAPVKIGLDNKPQAHHRGFFFRSHKIEPLTQEDYGNHDLDIDYASFVGPVIRTKTIKEAGLPNKDFFIWYDDVEFFLRARKHGRIILAHDAVILHKDANAAKKNRFGINTLPIDAFWKNLCSSRNYIYLMRKHANKGNAWSYYQMIARCAKIILFEDHKSLRIEYTIKACMDGINDKFNTIKPQEWKKIVSENHKN